ncbi:MAG: DcrB-related protein [Thermoleophilia bacterium]|nr:DcrB-related protein [Thermoleophilia bacterium]
MQRFKPQLTAPLPEGWFAKESITLLAPDGQANVIASSEPLDPTIDTNQYAQVQGDLLRKEFPGYREFAFEPARMLGGKQGYIRRFEWTPPDGVAVTQIQLYYAEEGRGYTATATTPSTQFERFEMQFRQLLGGLALDQAAAT